MSGSLALEHALQRRLYLRLGKELARTLLLGGSHVSPTVLEASGYEFTDPELEPALQRMLKG